MYWGKVTQILVDICAHLADLCRLTRGFRLMLKNALGHLSQVNLVFTRSEIMRAAKMPRFSS